MAAIETANLTRLYRNGRGIKQISLQVEVGEVFGFLGPNGAGKTTLIRTLLGFLHPQAGSAQVLGMDALSRNRDVRRRVGYLPSDPALYEFLTGAQHIDFALGLRGVRDRRRVRELAERLEISLQQRVKTLSRGNRQKIAIIAALAHDPDLVILDEPTSGLDPLVQETFADLIRDEKARGKTVFMSSHVLSEVEALCDRVGVIREGQIVTVSTIAQLKKRRVKLVTAEFAGAVPDLSRLDGVSDWQAEGSRIRFTLAGSLDPLVRALGAAPLVDLTLTDPPLEEVFRTFYEGGGGGR